MPVLLVSCLASAPQEAARFGADHVLSILDPDETPAPDLDLPVGRHVVLRVLDIEDDGSPGRVGPDAGFVESVLAFARSVPEDGRVLVHCHAGVSRSPAAALTMLAVWGLEPELPELLALPNMRMLELAEQITGQPLVAAGERLRRRTEEQVALHDLWPTLADGL